jgi:hypothetical protein
MEQPVMFEAVKNPCLVPFDNNFRLAEAKTLVKTVADAKQ